MVGAGGGRESSRQAVSQSLALVGTSEVNPSTRGWHTNNMHEGSGDELAQLALAETQTEFGGSRDEVLRCPRSAALKAHGLETVERPDYFELGSLVHSGLAYTALAAMRGREADFNYVLDVALSDGSNPQRVSEARSLLSAYFMHYGVGNAGWGNARIVDVERKLASEIVSPHGVVKITARADMLLSIDGVLCVPDHKTRKQMPSADDDELARGWRTRPQFLRLATLVQREFNLPEPPCVLVNMLVKKKVPEFRRVFVDFTQDEVDRWALEHAASQQFLATAVYANYSACAPDIGPRCWAFDHCHPVDGSERLYQVRRKV